MDTSASIRERLRAHRHRLWQALTVTVDGYRGAFLVLQSLSLLILSAGYVTVTPDARNVAFAWAPEWLQLWHFGIAFVALSGFALIVGLFSKKLSPRWMGAGFMAAWTPPLVAAGLFLVAVLHGATPALLIAGVLPNMIQAGAIYLASAWPNPQAEPVRTIEVPVPVSEDTAGSLEELRKREGR